MSSFDLYPEIRTVLCAFHFEKGNILGSIPSEIMCQILSYIDDRSLIERFVEVYFPDKPWNSLEFLKNKNMSPEFVLRQFQSVNLKDLRDSRKIYYISRIAPLYFIKAHPEINYNWGILSQNENITVEFIEEILETKGDVWYWGNFGLSCNPSITQEFVKKYITKPWNFGNKGGLSRNPVITPDFVREYINAGWIWDGIQGLSYNPSMTLEFIEEILETKGDVWNWGTNGLSNNSIVTPEFVEAHPDKPWAFGGRGLSSNPNITQEFILKYKYKPWNWRILSCKIKDLQFVLDHPELPWVWDLGLSINRNVTLEFIEKVIKEKGNIWKWEQLSLCPNITLEFIEKHIAEGNTKDKVSEWSWYHLSLNPNLTFKFVKKYEGKPWSWTKFSENPLY